MNVDGGDRVKIVDDADTFDFYDHADFSWSPDGSRIAFAIADRGSGGLFTVRPDGTGLERLPTGSLVDTEHPVFSPDGSRIAFSAHITRGKEPRVFVMNADGGDRILVGTGGHAPAWSPDGSKIAIDVNGSIYIVRPDGTVTANLIGCAMLGMDWSSDGSHLVVLGNGAMASGPGRCEGGAAIFLADAVFFSDADGPHRTKIVQPSPSAYSFDLWQPSG